MLVNPMNVDFAMTLQDSLRCADFFRDFDGNGWPTLKVLLPHCKTQDPSQLVGKSLCMHLQSVPTLFL